MMPPVQLDRLDGAGRPESSSTRPAADRTGQARGHARRAGARAGQCGVCVLVVIERRVLAKHARSQAAELSLSLTDRRADRADTSRGKL